MHFARFTLVAAIALLFSSDIPPARAASPLSYGDYYDETTIRFCDSGSTCSIWFSATPSNKLTQVRKLHCAITSNVLLGSVSLFVSTTNNISNTISRHLALPFVLSQPGSALPSTGFYSYTVDVDTMFLIGQTRYPYIEFIPLNGGTFVGAGDCTLIGNLINPIS